MRSRSVQICDEATFTNLPMAKLKRKLFAGPAIRALREERGWTQAALARRLGVSPSYLSQLEASQRSLSGTLVVDLARLFRVNVSAFTDDHGDKLAANLREALTDPVFGSVDIAARELRTAAVQMPHISKALLDLHGRYQALEASYRALDEAAESRLSDHARSGTAFEEVRDYFHFIGNYIDELDHEAESLAGALSTASGDPLECLKAHLASRYAIMVLEAPPTSPVPFVSRLDRAARHLTLNDSVSRPTKAFALARHVARIGHCDLIEQLAAQPTFLNQDSAAICAAALTNYFAGALLLPYSTFRKEALRVRHDVERLSAHFSASLEQICHRLSTLQRPGDQGVPMYFLRVDRAGNITKRHSATRFHFARYGGACPVWNIHQAFEAPDRFLVQRAEMPDGRQYLSIARAISKGETRFNAVRSRYAIGFGCEIAYADEFVYADAIKLGDDTAFIGINCRLCERADCLQRAVPPSHRSVAVDPDRRDGLPYLVR